ncbi:hypothetical protein JJB09_25390 [Rhizobium sp. KVB221]|uniref:DUF6894 domain-containing protein n=1 Tax=Rhizobium setariae TaxID=2801340 RepID=A0A937CR41_9HYPH|nr:hypothetical protein [Rhizobium setariae]MBL0375354.1 hypothetical protein [Rhizobium setariae]
MPLFYFTLRMRDHSVSEPFAHELPDLEAARSLASQAAAKLTPEAPDCTSAGPFIEIYDPAGALLDVISVAGSLL